MNLKKIWDGLTEKKVEAPKVLFKGEEHMVLFITEAPKVIVKMERELGVTIGRELTSDSWTYIIFKEEDGPLGFCFQKDIREEIKDILKDTAKLREYCKAHKEDLVPSCYVRETETPANDNVDKVKIGFGNVELMDRKAA